MKKITLLLAVTVLSLSAFSQSKPKVDTIAAAINAKPETVVEDSVHIVISKEQFKNLLGSIDANIDSKSASRDILQFMQRMARLVEVDKPKLPANLKPKQ